MNDSDKMMQRLLKQESQLQFPAFSNADALAIGTMITQQSVSNNYPVVIDICRHGQTLYYFANTGSSPDNEEWVSRKKKLTNRFGHCSMLMRLKFKHYNPDSFHVNGVTLDSSYTLSGGCFPIYIKNTGPIGTITVSGLTDIDDHNLVVNAIAQHLNVSPQ